MDTPDPVPSEPGNVPITEPDDGTTEAEDDEGEAEPESALQL